jgi:phosphoribosylamine---glycine ligase
VIKIEDFLMKVLIIGSGGREHAFAWKSAQSAKVSQVYVAPGNAGTSREKKVTNINICASDIDGLIKFAVKESIDLTIVGPELPLSIGIVDSFNKHNLRCLGPTQAAAQLESSKAYSKDFMKKYDIPTADYKCFTDTNEALSYLTTQKFPIVIKASGLAAGKGVIIAQSLEEGQTAVQDILAGNKFGNAGSEVVIEEFLEGEEASFIVLCDGDVAIPMATSQDHKARDNGDKGPNTGGMGAYSPAPVVTQKIYDTTMEKIIYPVLEGMKKQGTPYKGFLYAGLMITKQGDIKTLEYNCRFGDPETQPIMMRMKSDLVELSIAATEGKLKGKITTWSDECALGVVLAASGYPNSYPKGDNIYGLDSDNNVTNKIFHAGTKNTSNGVVSDGGRVLCSTALGKTIEKAYDNAYSLVNKIDWSNKYYRTDIGKKAFK